MSARGAARGQPLLVFSTILGAWLVGRVLMWEAPFPLRAQSPVSGLQDRAPRQAIIALPATQAAPESRVRGKAMAAAVARPGSPTFARLEFLPEVARFYGRDGNQLAQVPAPAPARLAAVDRPLLGTVRAGRTPTGKRWSGDGWLLWRDGSAAAAAPGVTAYGRSQVGAVLRYRLAAASPARPTVYARVTSALQRPGQAEAAAGLALRPLPGVPVSVAAEARVTDSDGGRRTGSAVFAVTELPPVALPFGLRGEAYVQAGYVSGRYQTAFADGQVRADRAVVRFGEDGELRAGLAAWGGAQEGAARLDVGPSAAVGFRLGETRSRLAVDYRVRVAGDAAPASGPAVTFSAGF